MIRRPLFPLGLLLPALALLAACGAPAPERVQPLPPGAFHIAIVVLDACRADKFSCYGLPRPTTPEVDALARDPDAVLFRRHYVQGAWTK
ncbi:MAG: hypothetical protein KBD01_20375, partial [Acidobacteria bacterium]|nr:hypothetical protein [Acidobacteriota bacterium]